MAAGAAETQSQHGLAERVDRVLNGEMLVILRIEAEAARDGQEAGGRHQFGVLCGRRLSGQNVAGDLLAQELIVGLVAVEGVDDVIAIEIRFGHRIVGRLAGGVGVTDHVKPVPAPALTVMRRGQQPIHHLRKSIRRTVGQIGVDFLRLRRQADQVESGPA